MVHFFFLHSIHEEKALLFSICENIHIKSFFFDLPLIPSMAKKSKSARASRRSSDSPMPQGGAGLIRFYQDASNGIKLSPITALVLAGVLVVVVILAHAGVLNWLIGSSV